MGACARQCVVAGDDILAARVPLLRQALVFVGHTQTRNRGTVGGSLAHADPSAELPLVAQILEARLVLRAKSGTRTLPAAEFFAGPMMTNLRADECLEEIHWPVWRERKTGSAFTEISRRHGDFAMVAAAAQIAVDDDGHCTRVTFGVGGAAPMPVAFPALAQSLVGHRLDKTKARAVAQEAAATLEPELRHPCQRRLSAPPRRRAGWRACCYGLRRREVGAMSEALYSDRGRGQRHEAHRPCLGAHVAGRLAARASPSHRHAYRLRARHLRRMFDHARW